MAHKIAKAKAKTEQKEKRGKPVEQDRVSGGGVCVG